MGTSEDGRMALSFVFVFVIFCPHAFEAAPGGNGTLPKGVTCRIARVRSDWSLEWPASRLG